MKKYEYELSSNMDIFTFYDMSQSSQGELKEKLSNIPFGILQPDTSLKRYDAGTYYNQIYDDGSFISFVKTNHSINILSRRLVNDLYIYRALYYELYSNDIVVKYYENDLNGSTHNPKTYINKSIPEKYAAFYFTADEVKPIVEEILSDIEKFEGIDSIIDLKEYRENVEKNLEGISRS